MVTFDSAVTAMSGDFQSMGWCCRDVRAQLSNTLNLVTYLQVQLLELMDENQQLKAQLEMCSEVKGSIRIKDSSQLFESKMERHTLNQTTVPVRSTEKPSEPCQTSKIATPSTPPPVAQSPPCSPVNGISPNSPLMEEKPLTPMNGSQFHSSEDGEQSHSPMNGNQPSRSEPLQVKNVRSEPLKSKLYEPRWEMNTPNVPALEGSFKCDKCSMSFPTADLLTFHQAVHVGKGFHVCKVCNAMFVVKSDLSKHLSIHPDIQQYICPICSKSYTSKNNFKLHVKVHTGEALYRCSFCGKSFHTENHLNVHLRTHTGERPYVCSYCQKSFTQKSGLVNHTRLHTGEKPFMCPICPKAFTQKSNLNFHLSKHHPPAECVSIPENLKIM